jgi:four helix bundle protein
MQPRFDHEKLDVYRVLLDFVSWVADLLESVKADGRAQVREVRDQLQRASVSALLNTAEGNGRRQRRTRAKFFDDARGSSTECAACLDALVAMRCCVPESVQQGKDMLVRAVSMLTKLVARFDGGRSGPPGSG